MLHPDNMGDLDDPEFLKKYEAYRLCFLEGVPASKLAETYQVNRRTIYRWINAVSANLRDSAKQEVASMRSGLTTRWDHIYANAMQAWEKSREARVEVTTKEVPIDPPKGQDAPAEPEKRVEVTTKRVEQAGTPAFLSIAGDALHGITGLWKHEMDAADRRDNTAVRVSGMTQKQMIESKIKQLQESLTKIGLNGAGGNGDRA